MAKYVVTGGAGFIGSCWSGNLSMRELLVSVIDNLLTGRECNLTEIRDRIEFHRADIRDSAAIAPLIAGADVVFHLAAIPSVPRPSRARSRPTSERGRTLTVLERRGEAGVRRVVYALHHPLMAKRRRCPRPRR